MEVIDIISMPIEPVKLLLLHRWIATSLLASAIVTAADRNTLRLTEEEKRIRARVQGWSLEDLSPRARATWEGAPGAGPLFGQGGDLAPMGQCPDT